MSVRVHNVSSLCAAAARAPAEEPPAARAGLSEGSNTAPVASEGLPDFRVVTGMHLAKRAPAEWFVNQRVEVF